ncbi:MAG TPA: hypothetical protein VLE96_04325 [Chlamydiales bacterium]|nr:hypothetical protein [Chlamydiales bacterium]
MSSPFQIWIDRLKNGQTQTINESFESDFLDIQEEELKMDSPVNVVGEAYLTEAELIIHLNASTKLKMPCAICNQMIEIDLEVKDCYHAVPINEIPSGIYDYKDFLRESLLIELPQYAECNQGNCPERKVIASYMHEKQKETSNFPFSNLGDSNGSTT